MQPETQVPNQQPAQWQFTPEQQMPTAGNAQAAVRGEADNTQAHVSWTASEFIAYQKGVGWYLTAFGVLLVLAALTYLLSRDMISAGAIFIIGILFIGFASRKPRVLTYEISSQGVKIGEKLYHFGTLKSFAVIEEESMRSIDILPLQRFMPAISMYYEPQDEIAIIEALGTYLPKEERQQPLIDKLMHRLRF